MINIDTAKLNRAILNAFKEACESLDSPLRDSIEQNIYEYPRQTIRRSGEIAGSPRNIVDLGELRDSQSLTFDSPKSATYSWDADHALLQHEGWTTKAGNEVPPRPWVDVTLSSIDIEKVFFNKLMENIDKA